MLTDEELKALVERLDHHNCECVVLDAAASAIRQLMREREWQPIETAPTDGTEIIVYDPRNNPPIFTASWINDWSCSVEGRYAPKDDFFGDDPKEPTHWMPLPTPPTPQS